MEELLLTLMDNSVVLLGAGSIALLLYLNYLRTVPHTLESDELVFNYVLIKRWRQKRDRNQ